MAEAECHYTGQSWNVWPEVSQGTVWGHILWEPMHTRPATSSAPDTWGRLKMKSSGRGLLESKITGKNLKIERAAELHKLNKVQMQTIKHLMTCPKTKTRTHSPNSHLLHNSCPWMMTCLTWWATYSYQTIGTMAHSHPWQLQCSEC